MMGKTVICVLLALQYAAVSFATNLDLTDWGFEEPDDSSCPPGATAGWYVDRMYNSLAGSSDFDELCFIRQVECTATGTYAGNFRTCGLGQFYIADGDSASCLDGISDAVRNACGVSVQCGVKDITYYVTSQAMYGQTLSGLQLGQATDRPDACLLEPDTVDNGDANVFQATVDLTSPNWDQCGVVRGINTTANGGTGIYYSVNIFRDVNRAAGDARVEETHNGVTVTRERCFMMTATCNYNDDGTVFTSMFPSAPNTLSESDQNTIDFQLVPRDCSSQLIGAAPIGFQTVFVGEDVCFRGSITTETNWHDNVRVSLRKCWASNQDPNAIAGTYNTSALIYPLSDMTPGVTDVDETFDWDCYAENGDGSPIDYLEDFRFNAFRYQDSPFVAMEVEYAQTIYVICDIVACELNDFTSDECTPKPDCPDFQNRRQRREAHSVLAQMTNTQIVHRMMVLPQPEGRRELVSSYSLLADTLALSMFAVGCVLAIVAVGLLAVLRQSRAQIRYSNLRR